MKKNLFKTAFMATFALMGAVLMSCGGSSSNSGKTLPTDGPFGEIPQLCSDYQDIQDKYTSGALNFEKDAMKKLTEAYDEYAEAFKAKAETMQGVEIKTEFAGDYPFKITKPFTITPFPGSKKFYSTGSFGSPADFSFVAEGETTEAMEMGYGIDFAVIAYDTDGNIIKCSSTTISPTERKFGKREVGTSFYITHLFVFNPWYLDKAAKLDKFVLIDRENELVQQCEESYIEARKGWQARQDSLRQQKQNK